MKRRLKCHEEEVISNDWVVIVVRVTSLRGDLSFKKEPDM